MEKERIPPNKLCLNEEVCYLRTNGFSADDASKVRDHVHYTRKYRGTAYNICNLRKKTPKKTPVFFHNGSTYDYHFIIKELEKKFEEKFECLRKTPINILLFLYQELDNNKKITYKLIAYFKFVSTSLQKSVNNLCEIYGKK